VGKLPERARKREISGKRTFDLRVVESPGAFRYPQTTEQTVQNQRIQKYAAQRDEGANPRAWKKRNPGHRKRKEQDARFTGVGLVLGRC
jgi:hypothetical protein